MEITALLCLATARQYLNEHELAQDLFAKALQRSDETSIDDLRHFILHHRGRCFAEMQQEANAVFCFEEALALRIKQRDERAASTRCALADLPRYIREG